MLYIEILKYLKIEFVNMHKWLLQFDVRNGSPTILSISTDKDNFNLVQYNLLSGDEKTYTFINRIKRKNVCKLLPEFRCGYENVQDLCRALNVTLIFEHIQNVFGEEIVCKFGKIIVKHIKKIEIILYNWILFENADTLCYNLMPTCQELELYLNVKY